jgi:hypothetical protein
MSLKPFICQTLSYFRIHRPDCQRCGAQYCPEIVRQRLMELNEHARRSSASRVDTKAEPSRNDAA